MAKLASGLNTENLVKRALFAIATHSNQDELTAAERKFAAAFENAYQASVESNDPAENDPASSNKELARHRRDMNVSPYHLFELRKGMAKNEIYVLGYR